MAIYVGTASWTDPEFIKAGWYPPEVKNDAAARLRYYADHFPMVEVNATFYALPSIRTVENWTDRTPDGFRFVVKAHQVISGPSQRPVAAAGALAHAAVRRATRAGASRARRASCVTRRSTRCSRRSARWAASSRPSCCQLPPSVACGDAQRAEVARIIGRLAPVRVAVEFRHRSWVTGAAREATMAMLAERDAAYVCVDAPRTDAISAMPPPDRGDLPGARVPAAARAQRRRPGRARRSVAERFNYRYSAAELEEFIAPVAQMSKRVEDVIVVFNNNAEDYALRNAGEFQRMITNVRQTFGLTPPGRRIDA